MHTSKEGTLSVNVTEPIATVAVTGDGAGVTSQAGTHLLGRIAGQLGVAGGFSRALAGTTSRSSAHDRGRVLTQLAMTIAAGGRCLSDLRTLRDQPALFGTVASDATAWRAVHQVDDSLLGELVAVRQAATRRLLEDAEVEQIELEVDATLLHLHSEDKQGAAATFKGGWGFSPMLCFIEPLGLPAGVLRPGGATANNAADQLSVIDQAIASLPQAWQAGHRPGDDPDDVQRRLVVRADTAGGSRKMIRGLAERNLVFAVGMRATDDAAAVIADLDEAGWGPAYDTGGRVRDGAQVREVPDLVPSWAPPGTRAIVRRERPHPGAQLRLWDHNGLRHQVTLTNDDTQDPTVIERDHRGHARVENRIKNLKDTGLSRLPFHDFDANRVWVELVQIAALLLAGLQSMIDDDELAVAEPRRLRYTLLHVAARITRHARKHWLRLDASWPWTHQLLAAHQQLDQLAATNA
jgi:hypothetical protein